MIILHKRFSDASTSTSGIFSCLISGSIKSKNNGGARNVMSEPIGLWNQYSFSKEAFHTRWVATGFVILYSSVNPMHEQPPWKNPIISKAMPTDYPTLSPVALINTRCIMPLRPHRTIFASPCQKVRLRPARK